MDWEGIKTAYLDRERARLGLPTRADEAALAEKRALAARMGESELESEAVGRELSRARLAALPEEQRLQRESLQALTAARNAQAARQPAEASSLLERIMAMPPDQQAAALKLHREMNPQREPAPDRVVIRVPTGVDDQGRPTYEYVPRSEVTSRTGVGVAPTTVSAANMARQRATPVLQDLGSRITSLNQGGEGGFVERAGGVARNVAGTVGMDPAADLYRTGVRGFTPLLARSVGHVGVLTEQDVARTEELFPRIGDSAAATAEKLARIQRIMSGQEPLPFQFENPSYDESGVAQTGGTPTVPQPSPTGAPKTRKVYNPATGRIE